MEQKKWIALLLSLLVLPGAGHVYLGEKKKGNILSLITIFFFTSLIALFVFPLRQQITSLPLSRSPLITVWVAVQQVWNSYAPFYILGGVILLILWIYAALDIIYHQGPQGPALRSPAKSGTK